MSSSALNKGSRQYPFQCLHILIECLKQHGQKTYSDRNIKPSCARITPSHSSPCRAGKKTIARSGLKERYKIERKFGEGNQQHGLGRCHYWGLAHYEVQAHLTAIAMNLNRMVKLLYGVNFRNPIPVMP